MRRERQRWSGVAVFPATLGKGERLITYAVGYGVGIGLPLFMGVVFAVGFSSPHALLLPVPFVLGWAISYLLRPTGFAVGGDEVAVLRPVGPRRIPLAEVRRVVSPATDPEGASIGILHVAGFHGSFGILWNRSWGRYRVWVTDHDKRVELGLADGSRVILSPDDPAAFVRAVRAAATEAGVEIAVREGRETRRDGPESDDGPAGS